MRRLPNVALPLLAALAGCSPSQAAELTDAERTAIADTVRSESAAWESAVEQADANGILSYYSETPGAAIIRSEQDLISFEEMKNGLPTEFVRWRSQSVTPREQRLDVLARDVAAESAVGDWTSTDTTGTVLNRQYALSRVWIRRDNKWKIFHTYIDVRPAAIAPSQAAPR